jgi:hypothetical protein
MGTIWRLLKKLIIDLPYDPVIPLIGIYLKECISSYLQRHLHTHVYCSIFTIAKLWKQPKCPTPNKWIKKMVFMQNGILFRLKEE